MNVTDEHSPTIRGAAEKFWLAAAAALLFLAVIIGWWRWSASGQADAAFVLATLGVVAWFLSLRDRLHTANVERDGSRASTDDEELGER